MYRNKVLCESLGKYAEAFTFLKVLKVFLLKMKHNNAIIML